MTSLQRRAVAALDPRAAALHARAGGTLDAAAAWLAAHEGEEWDKKSGSQLRSAARRGRGQSTFAGSWSGWSDQCQDDPLELLAAEQAAADLRPAALAAANLAADWEAIDTQQHAIACRITRRRAQQLRAWHLAALQIQGVLL
jgi:hypothetical protein